MTLRAKRLPLGAAGGQLAERPALGGAFRFRNDDRVGAPFADHRAPAGESFQRETSLQPIDRADHDETRAPRRRGKRGSQDPGVLIVSRKHPDRVGPGRLKRTCVREQLAGIAAEPQLRPDLHSSAMLASA